MTGRGRALAWVAVALAILAMATWSTARLPDPNAQPDGLVLRDLPPGAQVEFLRTTSGDDLYVEAWEREADGGVRYRRGAGWHRVPATELAGDGPAQWSGQRRFWMGTDGFGRDLASRVVHGGRVSLTIGFLGALIAIGFGGSVGLLAGMAGGIVDTILMRFTDLVLAVPRLFLAALLIALHGASLTTTVLVLGFSTWMAAARLVRGEVLSLKSRDFVEAARAAGAGPWRAALRHVLPGAATPLLIEGALRMGDTILLESSLSFLGIGVQPPTPSWGNLIADGRNSLLDAWWIATIPGLAIAVTVIALQLAAERGRRALRGSA